MESSKATLNELLRVCIEQFNHLTLEQKTEMLRKQAESWARSEAQWAKDFREGKCVHD